MGVSACTILYWETNRAAPAIRQLPKIVEFLGYAPFEQPITLAEQLVLRRRTLGLSRRQAARFIGVNVSTLAGWEKGQRRPMNKLKVEIESFLNVVRSLE